MPTPTYNMPGRGRVVERGPARAPLRVQFHRMLEQDLHALGIRDASGDHEGGGLVFGRRVGAGARRRRVV